MKYKLPEPPELLLLFRGRSARAPGGDFGRHGVVCDLAKVGAVPSVQQRARFVRAGTGAVDDGDTKTGSAKEDKKEAEEVNSRNGRFGPDAVFDCRREARLACESPQ